MATQALFMHICVALSQHAVPHIVPAQVAVQVVPLQSWPPVQAFPQLPQFVASEGTHELLHIRSPAAQPQVLFWHVWPPEHEMKQPPQLSLSDDVSTHPEPHMSWPDGQELLPPCPAVPVGLPVLGLEQAAIVRRKERQKPLIHRRAVFINSGIPGRR
jgi:hypothetical protein